MTKAKASPFPRWHEILTDFHVPQFLLPSLKYILPKDGHIEYYIEKLQNQCGRLYLSDKRRWRDKRLAMGNLQKLPSPAEYRSMVHQALVASEGFCFLSGQPLDWSLWSMRYHERLTYLKDTNSIINTSTYPSFDHEEDAGVACGFRLQICSLSANMAKSQLNTQRFLDLCEAVLLQHRPHRIVTFDL